jgi:hypothetical protein
LKRAHSLLGGLLLVVAVAAPRLPAQADVPVATAVSPAAAPVSRPVQTRLARNFGQLPLSFERNLGQTDRQVRFLTRSLDSTLFLTPSEAVFLLTDGRKREGAAGISRFPRKSSFRPERKQARAAVRMQLVGADPGASAIQEQPLSGRINYFLGKDPSRWQAGVPTFGRAGFKEVYRGVDLVYYGNQSHLEYDFVVAPYADPGQIRLHFAGAQGVHLSAAGDLIVRTPGGALRWRKPTVYQRSATGARAAVAARFRLVALPGGRTDLCFTLGRYDHARPLVIDPVLVYATYLGGSGAHGGDVVTSIAVDSAGSAYVTGYTGSLDFPAGVGAYQRANRSGSGSSAFVAKLNPAGTALVYATYIGGSTQDNANGIAVDAVGSAYITGRAFSADFPTTPGAYQRALKANHNAFVTKLNPAGDSLVYSTYLGGTGSDSTVAIALDAAGHAFVTGHTISPDFPTTPNAFQAASKSPVGGNAFVTELDIAGDKLVYSTCLGGSSEQGDFGKGIAVDAGGSAYVVGDAFSADFPSTQGAYQRAIKALDNANVFVTKFNPAGTALVYSTYLGGSIADNGNSIAVDGSGQAFVAGNTFSPDFPTTPGSFQSRVRSPAGVVNAFVAKLNADGSALIYSTYLSGSAGCYTYRLALDKRGDAVVTGYTDSTDFPTTVGAYRRAGIGATVGKTHSYVTRLSASGDSLAYSTYLGGTGGDYAGALALDGNGDAYVAGYTGSADFPVTPGAMQTVNKALAAGSAGAFVTKLTPIPVFPDFDADGRADLFLQNAGSSVIAAWFMEGTRWQGGVYFSLTPPQGYTLVGAGDFRGNGTLALVLQNRGSGAIALWYTGGADHGTITGGDYVDVNAVSGWDVVGVGDFNGDGKSDLVFQNRSTGQVAIWLLSGARYQAGVLLPFVPAAGWKLAATGDIDGDGSADLIFQNQNTGQIALWYMHGTTYAGGVQMTTIPAPGWKVVGAGDYNRDGYLDLLLQSQTGNQTVMWFLRNGAFVAGDLLSLAPPPGWNIAGPR